MECVQLFREIRNSNFCNREKKIPPKRDNIFRGIYSLLITHHSLFRHLELTRFNEFASLIAKLVNIHAAREVSKIDGSVVSNV
jgi:hypothetical protein